LLTLNLEDLDAVRRVVAAQRPDWIFHLAAHGAYSWQGDIGRMLAVNVACTDALLDVGRTVEARFVYAGSSSEYGFVDHPPRENERLEPNSHYAVTKAAGTHLCALASEQHGQHAVSLRLYSVYGPWEEPGRLIPALVSSALEGKWPPLVSPDVARDFVWVGDACDAFVRAVDSAGDVAGGVFNIGSGVQTRIDELVEIVRGEFQVDAEPEWGTMEDRAWDTTRWLADPSKAERELGWRASTTLRDGLNQMGLWLSSGQTLGSRDASRTE
jgi:nucleoside-diphosphate-sugar epimerase